ncbi:MAG: bifunctional UDP-4-keto-pentose/UDP-xylose synthase [Verrucomicrobiaceae bacterium]|nr:bifunctional UDP-4-keto-pentose/UDP-xylose synthase [Verrucomicrobiaceae bacterium]
MNVSGRRILILGANGFIGSSLTLGLLRKNYDVVGVDLSDFNLNESKKFANFLFRKIDVLQNFDEVESLIKECDIVVALVAIAVPSMYVKNPIAVYNLDYEHNVQVIKTCVQYGKRIVFPSTSEVYGMCSDKAFDERLSQLVLGSIEKERWIYSCIKQMLDRLIWAYGKHEGLQFTIFRPFNFIGPKLDNIKAQQEGASRVITQFAHNILNSKPIKLVDGGFQKRCFTFIDDGIDCLLKIIENKNGCADGQIFNIGNPTEEYSIKELADILISAFKEYPEYTHLAENAEIVSMAGSEYYGKAYEDVGRRVPSIANAKSILGWSPKTDIRTAVKYILDYHLLGKDYEACI